MSSVGSAFAQIGARRGYFYVVRGGTGNCDYYTLTFDVAGVTALGSVIGSYATNDILEDMGEVAKFKGQLFRRVRKVTQVPTGTDGAVTSYFIVMPGGEYPVQGTDGVGVVSAAANVARLG
jgi:hypothetical protein